MKNYTMIQNEIAQDKSLSFEARGLLMMMLTFPNDWNFSIPGLMSLTDKSEATVTKYVGELKAAGYIEQVKVRNKAGQFSAYDWTVRETPEPTKNRASEICAVGADGIKNRAPEKPSLGNLYHIQINNTNKGINTTNDSKEKSIKEKADPFEALLVPLNPDLRDAFREFLKMRKAIKAPMTERALALAIKKANDLSGGDPDKAKAIVEQSIMNSWKGLFPLKDEGKAKTAPIYENPFTKLRREEGFE